MIKPSLVLFVFVTSGFSDNWPAWRGPHANGVCDEKNLPRQWSATENVRWKMPLPGPGNSTPIIWGDRVFLTQSLDKGGQDRALLCLDRRDGKLHWQKSVKFEGKESTHGDNPYCSASPATDGYRVVASFGSAGVACYDFDGKQLWHRDLGKFEHIWGNASSPVIHGDRVFLNCGPGERTFLIALDLKSGKDLWSVEEPGGKFGKDSKEWLGSWSTPVVARINKRDELIMTWPDAIKSYNPHTGELLWTCRGLTKLAYTSPLVTPDVVVAMSGYGGSWIACKTGGQGDVTETHRLWRNDRAPQRIGSGVIVGDHIYMVNEPGTAQCIELATGKTLWNERLGSGSWGNLVLAEGRLYVTNLAGETGVFAAKPQFEVLAKNPLGEKTLASIAVSNGDIFIRTYQNLWCIANPNQSKGVK